MKKITVQLSEKAEVAFNELMYSLPKNPDGTGMCSQSEAISYALECVLEFEEKMGVDILNFLSDKNETKRKTHLQKNTKTV